jgi:hypothetical protein
VKLELFENATRITSFHSQAIYQFRLILRMNCDHFAVQHLRTGICNRHTLLFRLNLRFIVLKKLRHLGNCLFRGNSLHNKLRSRLDCWACDIYCECFRTNIPPVDSVCINNPTPHQHKNCNQYYDTFGLNAPTYLLDKNYMFRLICSHHKFYYKDTFVLNGFKINPCNCENFSFVFVNSLMMVMY